MRSALVLSCLVVLAACDTPSVDDDASVGCRHVTDCVSGLVCVAGACTPAIHCTSSRMCDGLVCDIAASTCVECVRDADCSDDARCRSEVCEAVVLCGSDRDCSAMAEVCSVDVGLCVECNTSTDCNADALCTPAHTCATISSLDASIDGAPSTDAGMDAAIVVDAGADVDELDAGRDGGHDAYFPHDVPDSSRTNGTWETIPAGGGLANAGLSDYTRAGETALYATNGSPGLRRLDGVGAWVSLVGPPVAGAHDGVGVAWVGDMLYLPVDTTMYRYDVAGGTWTSAGTISATISRVTHDDAGHVFFVTNDGRIGRYDTATHATTYIAFGIDMVADPMIAWDSAFEHLYVVPNRNPTTDVNLYAVDPVTAHVVDLAAFAPGSDHVGGTFCADRTGHLYAGGNTSGTMLQRYDIATDHWDTPISALPFAQTGGPCTVTADGWLYVTDDGTHLARYRLW